MINSEQQSLPLTIFGVKTLSMCWWTSFSQFCQKMILNVLVKSINWWTESSQVCLKLFWCSNQIHHQINFKQPILSDTIFDVHTKSVSCWISSNQVYQKLILLFIKSLSWWIWSSQACLKRYLEFRSYLSAEEFHPAKSVKNDFNIQTRYIWYLNHWYLSGAEIQVA